MNRINEPFAFDGEIDWEPAGEGIRRKILTYNAEVMMVRVEFQAGAVGTPHSHPHIQCSLVEAGTFDVTIAGRTERLKQGDSFLVPPHAVHGAVAVEAGVLLDVFTPMREDFV
ncbi:cupin domain-containing protein [Microvirga lotononidis]|uniref:Cupin domain-containing protein n=1 Tax=Microvirga lotononidis TaxID=864069 RepID=I4YVW5_9HYPH|nr:cupin domain-containing protein [Microvirga lotononidis]EIM28107.1 cupin domain-containing protein [Microvirga lotononidis]WQO27788.1 cupin domain-containing protein [Microvirga lotononidis]